MAVVAPSAPNIKTQPFASPNSLEFSWSPPDSDGGAPIDRYLLEVFGDPQYNNLAYSDETAGTARYYKVGGILTNGVTYYVTLKASNDTGATWGPPAYFRPFQPGHLPTVGPATATAALTGPGKALVSWTAPPPPLPDATIFWYVITAIPDNPTETIQRASANGLTDTSYYFDKLNQLVTYYFTVQAVNCPGYSPKTLTNSISQIGGSAEFNDTSKFDISPGIAAGAGAFTFESWIQVTSDMSGTGFVYYFLTDNIGSASNLNISYELFSDKGDLLSRVRLITSEPGSETTFIFNPAINDSNWHYLAISRDNTGDTNVWIDGAQSSNGVQNITYDFNDTSAILLYPPTLGFTGYVTNFRAIIGSNVYNPNDTSITVPTVPLTNVPNTEILLKFINSGSLTYNSAGAGYAITDNNYTWSSNTPF